MKKRPILAIVLVLLCFFIVACNNGENNLETSSPAVTHSSESSEESTQEPSQEPSKEPTPEPSEEPTQEPSKEPSQEPSIEDLLPIPLPFTTDIEWEIQKKSSSHFYICSLGQIYPYYMEMENCFKILEEYAKQYENLGYRIFSSKITDFSVDFGLINENRLIKIASYDGYILIDVSFY